MNIQLFALFGLVAIPFLSWRAEALDLRVSTLKSALRPGEATELIATLANSDNSTRTNVTLDFVMPAGFSGNTAFAYPVPARGVTTLDPGEGVGWDIPQLLPGQIVHRRIMVFPLAGGSALPNGTSAAFDFVASVGGVPADTFSRSITVDASHDLDAAISLETAGPVAGEPFEVVIAYGNRGTQPQASLSVALELPSGTTLIDASAIPAQGGGFLTWTPGTLNPGEVGQIVLRLQSSIAGTPGELRNLAMTVTSATRSQGAQAVLTPGTLKDLKLALGHSSLPLANPGDPVQLTTSLTNSRNFAGSTVKIRLLTPDHLSGNSAWTDETLAAGVTNFEPGELVGWDFSAIQPLDTLQTRIQLWPAGTATAGSIVPLASTVTDSSGAQALAMLAIPIHAGAGVNLELAASDAGFKAGEDFRLILSLGNRSASPVADIRPRVTLPAALLQNLQISGGNASLNGDILAFDLLSLAPGSCAERVITGRVAANVTTATEAAGGLAKQISAFADTSSVIHASTLATLSQTVRDQEILDLEMSADRTFLRDNEPARVQLTVTNRGAFPLTDLVLDTILPESMEGNIAWAMPNPTRGVTALVPTELTGWNIPNLAVGASLTHELLLYADAPAAAGSVVALKARVRNASRTLLDDAQLNLSLVQDPAPDLLLSCGQLPASAGETIRFTVTYGNPSSSPMTAANLSVALPRGLEFIFGESGITHTPDPAFPAEGGGTLTLPSGGTLQPNSLSEAVFYARALSGLGAGTVLPVKSTLTVAGRIAGSGVDLAVSLNSNLKLSVSQDGLPLTSTSKAHYVFTVTNRGSSDLTDVVVRFLFPTAAAGNTSWTSPATTIGVTSLSEAEQTGWQIPLLPAGSSRFFRCILEEATATDGQISSLVARADASDGSQTLAHSQVVFDSDAQLDLALTGGSHAVLPGGTFNLQLALGNRSATPIGSSSIRLDLPGELLEVIGPPEAPPLVGNALLWNRSSLAPAEVATVPLTLRWRVGVPAGSQAKIQARAVSATEITTADLVLAATTAIQAELIPAISADDTTPTNGQQITLTLQPHNTSSFQRANVVSDFFVTRGISGNVANASPPVNIGVTSLDLNERIGWSFATFAPAQNPALVQPMTFTVAAGSPRGSVIPVSAGVVDNSQGGNLASIAFLSDPAVLVSLTPINPVGSNPADLDNDGIADIYETSTGVYVSEFDTGTRPADPDSDNDGIVDGKELESGFLNPTRDDSFIVAFFEQRTRDLAFGAPILARDPTTGEVALKIGLRESPNLGNFTKRPIQPAEASIVDGDILLEFPTTEDAFFYRFHGSDAIGGN